MSQPPIEAFCPDCLASRTPMAAAPCHSCGSQHLPILIDDAAVQLAQRFHEAYERLAPEFGYATRTESAVPWSQVPASNRALMIAVCTELLREGKP